MNRRDLILAGACGVGAATAYGLIPRHHVSLLHDTPLEAIIPRTFGPWLARDVGDLVAPKTEDSLAAKLYSQTVSRIYAAGNDGPRIMVLLAYGDTQSDDLQLHRPEVCYPAFGFGISDNRPTFVEAGPGVAVPGRSLLAHRPDHLESIVYWSRLGEYFPLTGTDQQYARLRTAMRGDIADGLLARFSMISDDQRSTVGILSAFAGAMIRAVAPAHRPVLIGTQRANALSINRV